MKLASQNNFSQNDPRSFDNDLHKYIDQLLDISKIQLKLAQKTKSANDRDILLKDVSQSLLQVSKNIRMISKIFASQYKKFSQEENNGNFEKEKIDLKKKNLSKRKKIINPLTNAEMDVLKLLNRRLSYKECAQKLTVSPNTIKKHAVNIYQKLNVHSRKDAISKAEKIGIYF